MHAWVERIPDTIWTRLCYCCYILLSLIVVVVVGGVLFPIKGYRFKVNAFNCTQDAGLLKRFVCLFMCLFVRLSCVFVCLFVFTLTGRRLHACHFIIIWIITIAMIMIIFTSYIMLLTFYKIVYIIVRCRRYAQAL